MAKINALPSLEVINTLKGTLDFYYWKGIPCVRKWPHIPHSSRTQPSLDSAHLFGLIVQGWALVGGTAKALYIEAAADQPRTGRDLYVSGVLGGQHEASMSDFLDLLTECRDYLAYLQALLGPLGTVDTDDLQVDIKTALTTLPVRGQDQLFSIADRLLISEGYTISGANGWIQTLVVPAGEYWGVTNLCSLNATNATTGRVYAVRVDPTVYRIREQRVAIALGEYHCWPGHVFMEAGDQVRVYFQGALAGDDCFIHLNGYRMTMEV